jgi:hypothetical protein
MEVSNSVFKPGISKTELVDVLCIECKRPTKHLVAAFLDEDGSTSDDEERWSIEWSNHYQIVKCQGCETVTFRQTSWFSEQDPYEPLTERLYPKRDAKTINAKPFLNISNTLRRIYGETVDCFNNESMTLCAAGLRAMVEGVCADQKIIDGPVEVSAKGGGTQIIRKINLEGKISGLHEKGILTQSSAITLHELRFLGNDAVHELVSPSSEELLLAINIVEHVLEQLYEIPSKALQLKQKSAARKK